MLGQPVSMLIPEVDRLQAHRQAARGHDRDRPRAHRHPDAAQEGRGRQVRGILRSRPHRHDGRRPRHHRQHGARIRRHLRLLPDRYPRPSIISRPRAAPTSASRWSRPMPRRRACGARPRRPIRSSPTPSSSISTTWCRRWPARSVRRTASRSTSPSPNSTTRHGQGIPQGRRARTSACKVEGANFDLGHGDVVIAAITSCTNTSNPERDDRRGPSRPQRGRQGPEVQAVGEDLARAGLADRRGIFPARPACRATSTRSASTSSASAAPPASAIRARCPENVSKAINDNDLVAVSVLSGNRNFEGRVNPDVRANYLASPPLVVAYALAGSMLCGHRRTIRSGSGPTDKPVYLRDIWPSSVEIQEFIDRTITSELFKSRYADVFTGDENWKDVDRRGRPDLQVGAWVRPMCRTRPTSRA